VAKDAYYFKHDAHARHDLKITALIKKYGIEGYGRFWIVLEIFREQRGYKLEDKKYVWETLGDQMHCSGAEAKKFIDDCIEEFELFVKGDGFFFSEAFLERMTKLDDIRLKRSLAAHERWGSHDKD